MTGLDAAPARPTAPARRHRLIWTISWANYWT